MSNLSVTTFGITFVVFSLLSSCSSDKKETTDTSVPATTAPTPVPKEEAKPKQWTTVYTFEGDGAKKSPSFELTGNEARVKYKYKCPEGAGMGAFIVYVMEAGKDLDKDGGMPEIMTSAEKEESESALQKSAGRYYLSVNAEGKWTVTIEELI